MGYGRQKQNSGGKKIQGGMERSFNPNWRVEKLNEILQSKKIKLQKKNSIEKKKLEKRQDAAT